VAESAKRCLSISSTKFAITPLSQSYVHWPSSLLWKMYFLRPVNSRLNKPTSTTNPLSEHVISHISNHPCLYKGWLCFNALHQCAGIDLDYCQPVWRFPRHVVLDVASKCGSQKKRLSLLTSDFKTKLTEGESSRLNAHADTKLEWFLLSRAAFG
jgi:hypothetical protein